MAIWILGLDSLRPDPSHFPEAPSPPERKTSLRIDNLETNVMHPHQQKALTEDERVSHMPKSSHCFWQKRVWRPLRQVQLVTSRDNANRNLSSSTYKGKLPGLGNTSGLWINVTQMSHKEDAHCIWPYQIADFLRPPTHPLLLLCNRFSVLLLYLFHMSNLGNSFITHNTGPICHFLQQSTWVLYKKYTTNPFISLLYFTCFFPR